MNGMSRKIISGAAVLALGLLILSLCPFRSQIQQDIPANIYRDGVVTGTTAVSIQGERRDYLFQDDCYEGRFVIPEAAETGREGVLAYIDWDSKYRIQRIMYASPGSSVDAVLWTMLINKEMDQFALTLEDGRVLATSDELFQIYTEHFIYDPVSGTTAIVGNIPKIERETEP